MASSKVAPSLPGGCAVATPSTMVAMIRCHRRTHISPSIAMDNRRMFLVAAVAIIGFAVYQTWMLDYGPRPEPESTAPAAGSAAAQPPAYNAGAPAAASSVGAVSAVPTAIVALPKGQAIHVRTDVLDLTLDTAGGDIRRAELIQYPETLKDPTQHVRVLDDAADTLLVQQGGLQSEQGAVPDADAVYTTAQTDYTLASGRDTLKVALNWSNGRDLKLVKTYTLTRGSYQIGVDYSVQNIGKTPWAGSAWLQWQNRYTPPHNGLFSGTARYEYQRLALRDADG